MPQGCTAEGRPGSIRGDGMTVGRPWPEAPARVAVVRLGAIGDVIHAIPVVWSLRRAWPDCEITWAIQPGPQGLVGPLDPVDEFVLFDRRRGARGALEFRRAVAGRSYDLVVDLHPCFKGALATRLLDAPVRLGYDRRRARDLSWLATNRRIPARPPAHVQDEYFEFLECLGVPVHTEWDLCFSEEERVEQRRWLAGRERPVLAVVTRSSRREKDWTLERHARVLDAAAADFGYETVLVGGGSAGAAADARRLRELCSVPPRVELRDDLRRLAWLLDASAAVIAPDTGPLHLAVALGTPTIGLYGATDPARVGPYRRFADLLVDRYTRPDGSPVSRSERRANMRKIREEDVIEKLDVLRSRYGVAGA